MGILRKILRKTNISYSLIRTRTFFKKEVMYVYSFKSLIEKHTYCSTIIPTIDIS